ncbi:MAG: Mu-like prophage major head subunit gpT family protein [Sulfuricaulis sp.]|nr:Mu-like prophage major head subunit gpT family protein [Sulfuricaulis sp.]
MANELKPKPRLMSDVTFGQGGGMDPEALREAALADPNEFAGKIQRLIASGKLTWNDVRSLPRLFNRLYDVEIPARIQIAGSERSIPASAFPLLAGGMTVAGLNAAYDMLPTIGQELVTEMESNKKIVEVAAITSEDTQIDRVDEGKEFPEIGAGEEKFEIRSKRNGRRLSITAETIEENDVSGIVDRINALATISGNFVEEQTLRRVCDIDGSATSPAEPYVLHINGAGVALYQTAATTLTRLHASGNRYQTNVLADESDLENARTRLAGMKDSMGKRINIPMSRCTLLVPDALVTTARKILNSTLVPGVENEYNDWGPTGAYRPRLLSSPKLDDLSTTVWYLGDFQAQFRRKWKLRFEYVTLGQDTESFLRSRIAFQARVAWDVEIGAVDYCYVVQNLSATTAP